MYRIGLKHIGGSSREDGHGGEEEGRARRKFIEEGRKGSSRGITGEFIDIHQPQHLLAARTMSKPGWPADNVWMNQRGRRTRGHDVPSCIVGPSPHWRCALPFGSSILRKLTCTI